jgi:hypothetical protein
VSNKTELDLEKEKKDMLELEGARIGLDSLGATLETLNEGSNIVDLVKLTIENIDADIGFLQKAVKIGMLMDLKLFISLVELVFKYSSKSISFDSLFDIDRGHFFNIDTLNLRTTIYLSQEEYQNLLELSEAQGEKLKSIYLEKLKILLDEAIVSFI